ncbi:MAG TPA: diaminopimelate decarboxylase [Pseudogracilibacillus sp.]|nr:diaminopimelate decarboxylase [Pseudogracilibacillus sp.]
MLQHHPFMVNNEGHLEIDGVDTVHLATQFGTPLYVYDVSLIRKNCRAFVDTFQSLGVKSKVSYASKAFSSIAMLQVIEEEGLGLDVVSKGELYTAIKANFPGEKIQFHGNNKSRAELEMALEYGVGTIIIDNFYEIQLLEQLARDKRKRVDVLLRLTPGIESETHRYIMTGNEDSKFGFNVQNGQADEAFKRVKDSEYLNLRGIHNHIGSQIFTTKSFALSIDILFNVIKKWYEIDRFIPEVINLGGGFGIRYTKEDEPLPLKKYVEAIVEQVSLKAKELDFPLPEIWIEPGRSIVGDSGITLYTIGSMKEIEGVRKYVAVDGSMADNIRPALYDAKYEGIIANKALKPPVETVSIAGKACESGDMIIWDLQVPEVEHGDILAVFSTGAYGYAMASNYNRLRRPAVVFVEKGHAKVVVKRESLEDLIKNDVTYIDSAQKIE